MNNLDKIEPVIMQRIASNIDVIENFPSHGIVFRNIGRMLSIPDLFSHTIKYMGKLIRDYMLRTGIKIDYLAGFDARGFLFAQIALDIGCGFVMIRKSGKLPNCTKIEYEKEYGKDCLCIENDIIPKGSNVLMVDDLIATGGTIWAGSELIKMIGSNPIGCVSLIQLVGLKLCDKLSSDIELLPLIKYRSDSKSQEIDPILNPNLFTFVEEYIPIGRERLLESDQSNTIVFYHPSLKTLGENYISNNEGCRKGSVLWNKFPDGQPNIRFEHMDQLAGKEIVFFMSLFDKTNLFEQLSLLMVLPRQLIKSLNIYIPYFSVGTMERVDYEGILATAETMAKIISNCVHSTQTGPPIIHIWDIHALPIRFYFTDNVIIKLESGIELLKKQITDKTIIVFPDDGSSKRFGSSFRTHKKIVCSKVREDNKRKIRIVDQVNFPIGVQPHEVEYDNVVIVDDLVQTGGTLLECAKALKQYGFINICAYATHSIFPNNTWKKFTESNLIKKFYTTNSVPEISDKLKEKEPFVVLNLFGDKKNDNKVIYVSSHNQQKLRAVYEAFVKKLQTNNISVFGLNANSNVPEQPIGIEQTKLGCLNRLTNMKSYLDLHSIKYDYLVSLENGIENWNDAHSEKMVAEDFCCVQIFFRNENKSSITSSICLENEDNNTSVIIPEEFYKICLQFEQKKTIGQVISEKTGIPSDSFHQKYNASGLTRIEIMSMTVDYLLENKSAYYVEWF